MLPRSVGIEGPLTHGFFYHQSVPPPQASCAAWEGQLACKEQTSVSTLREEYWVVKSYCLLKIVGVDASTAESLSGASLARADCIFELLNGLSS